MPGDTGGETLWDLTCHPCPLGYIFGGLVLMAFSGV